MATSQQTSAARRNVTKAQDAASSKRTIAHMPKKTRTPVAKQRDLPGRSKMGRDELAGKLDEKKR